MLDSYYKKAEARKSLGVVPEALTKEETLELVSLLEKPLASNEKELVSLLENRIPPGVDDAIPDEYKEK